MSIIEDFWPLLVVGGVFIFALIFGIIQQFCMHIEDQQTYPHNPEEAILGFSCEYCGMEPKVEWIVGYDSSYHHIFYPKRRCGRIPIK